MRTTHHRQLGCWSNVCSLPVAQTSSKVSSTALPGLYLRSKDEYPNANTHTHPFLKLIFIG